MTEPSIQIQLDRATWTPMSIAYNGAAAEDGRNPANRLQGGLINAFPEH